MEIYQKDKGLKAAFVHAFEGLIWSFKSQLNLKMHLLCTFLVLILGWFFKINYYEWLIVTAVIFNVLVLELINTSLEQATDAISQEYNPLIKRAKDVSAAAVLTVALYALIIGLIVFGSKF